MSDKVYWKSLILKLRESKRYIDKWTEQLESNLTSEVYAEVIATRDAIQETLNHLPKNDPTDPV